MRSTTSINVLLERGGWHGDYLVFTSHFPKHCFLIKSASTAIVTMFAPMTVSRQTSLGNLIGARSHYALLVTGNSKNHKSTVCDDNREQQL